MTGILGWLFTIVLWYISPTTTMSRCRHPPGSSRHAPPWANLRATRWNNVHHRASPKWFALAGQVSAGTDSPLLQVMVLLAIAVALATRLPMIVTLVTC